MLYFETENLVYLANPKTGSMAVEAALAGRAAMEIRSPSGLRHMNVAGFRNSLEPMITRHSGRPPELFVVVREPLSHLLSWYRYRRRGQIAGSLKSTSDLTAEAFLLETLKDEPAPCALVGSQSRFVGEWTKKAPPDFLFPYERPERLRGFLEARFGAVELPQVNVSPREELTVSAEIAARVRAARAADVALYERVLASSA